MTGVSAIYSDAVVVGPAAGSSALKSVPCTRQGASLASCGGCDRRWNGLAEAHCAACHRSFSTAGAFDAHRMADRCLDPEHVVDRRGQRRLLLRQRLDGAVWVRAFHFGGAA